MRHEAGATCLCGFVAAHVLTIRHINASVRRAIAWPGRKASGLQMREMTNMCDIRTYVAHHATEGVGVLVVRLDGLSTRVKTATCTDRACALTRLRL